jgi:hypothetical protein
VSDYLAARLAELGDDELLRRAASRNQSAESITLIAVELHRRGIAVPEQDPEDDGLDSSDLEGVSDALVEFARYGFPIEAHLLRERLEAEGVRAWVVNANVAQTFGYLRDAVGGARVMIRPDDVEAASQVLVKLDAGDYSLDESGEPGEAASAADKPTPVRAERATGEVTGTGARMSPPLRRLLLVVGVSLAIASVFIASQEPKLWWVLLWLPVAVVRWLMRRTLEPGS